MFIMRRSVNYFYLLGLLTVFCLHADVRVEFPGSFIGDGSFKEGPTPNIYNTTISVIDLAGWRFTTFGYEWTQLSGDPGATVTITDENTFKHHETRLSQSSTRRIIYTGETPVTQNLKYNGGVIPIGQIGTPLHVYVLLKTGAAGAPGPYLDEQPINIAQIDSLIALPGYYNANHRYKDSLGTHGGIFSGGLIDTYLGETQILLPIPESTFVMNATNINLDPSETGGPLYWMALAMGQEYLGIDMQLMISVGFKESGIAAAGLPYANSIGVYGPFHIENWTVVARAIAYPKFYPDYVNELQSSVNATVFATTVMPANDFCAEYMGSPTPQNSAFTVNAVVINNLNWWILYNLLSYSRDMCWKEVLEFCVDPHVGVAAILPLYNLGMNSGSESPLHVNNYQSLLNDPNASNQFPPGNGNYRIDILNAVKALSDASTESLIDTSIVLWDTYITLEDIETFFFGDSGTVSSQGSGGLLKHFTVDRQQIWTDVQAAFIKLSTNWGQNPAAISWRYDWLTLLRTVKKYFNVSRPKPSDYESLYWIEQRSKIGGCSGSPSDAAYPFMTIVDTLANDTFFASVNVTDNKNIRDVKWTLYYNWDWWYYSAFISGTATDKNYEITIPVEDIKEIYGDDTGYVWISATDSSGNTIVEKVTIANDPTEVIGDSKGAEQKSFLVELNQYLFNSRIRFTVFLPGVNSDLKVILYNVSGKEVDVLWDGRVKNSRQCKTFAIEKIYYPSGLYFLEVVTGNHKKVLKLQMLK